VSRGLNYLKHTHSERLNIKRCVIIGLKNGYANNRRVRVIFTPRVLRDRNRPLKREWQSVAAANQFRCPPWECRGDTNINKRASVWYSRRANTAATITKKLTRESRDLIVISGGGLRELAAHGDILNTALATVNVCGLPNIN
jgi:hypothetical protein